ncbi:MAG: PAS domain S-box protein [Deltaproteobacteria bacterium]|nr:PAS domain S-box protein [Deltaproteobacteria bacterium]
MPTYEELLIRVQELEGRHARLVQAEQTLRHMEWLLRKAAESPSGEVEEIPSSADLTALNRSAEILACVGKRALREIAADCLRLLGTSSAIHERDGHCALRVFSPGWCRLLEQASRRLYRKEGNQAAVEAARRLCQESCCTDAAKAAIEQGTPVDKECDGGIRLCAVPILADGDSVGAISFGYGDPPRDPEKLHEIAVRFGVSVDELQQQAEAYGDRPLFIIDLARKRLEASARLIGEMVARRRTQAALEESQGRYRELFNHMNNCVVVYEARPDGSDFVFKDLNRAAERVEKTSKELLIGKPVTEVFPGIKAMSLFNVFRRVWKTGQPERHPVSLYQDERLVSWRENYVYKLPSGEIVAIYEDITERNQTEERLRILVELLDISPACVTVHDFKGNFIYANQRAFDLHGYGREEFLALNLHQIDVPQSEELIESRMKTIMEEGEATFEVSHYRNDGTSFPLEVRAKLTKWEDQPVLLSMAVDITERKRDEDALRQSEENYRTLVESSSDAILLLNPERTIVSCNSAFLQLFGHRLDEVKGRSTRIIHSSDDRFHSFGARVYPVVEERGAYRGEWELMRKDGSPLSVETVTSRIRSADGKTRGYVAIIRDMSERKREEEEKRRLEEQLQQAQKMEAIGTLAGGIAHDFNNILGIIMGCTELAMMEVSKEGGPVRHLNEVCKAGERARDLVNQILAFSRRGEQVKKALDPSLVLKETMKMMRYSLPSTVQIQQEIRRNCGTVLADPTDLDQVLMNLCVNAAHAMREKGGTLKVSLMGVDLLPEEVATLQDVLPGPYCKLTVSDTGDGMDRAILDRIFDPYFTTKSPGEGTGLGLAVVHGIVKSHGGAIRVESEPGKGATFEVFLPRIDEPTHVAAREDLGEIPRGSERILLVDDERSLTVAAKGVLESLGYRVTSRTSSLEALETFRAQPDQFDLVITDMTMPYMTGSELSRRILEIRSDIPIILCTGYSEVMTKEKARELGVREFLLKPIVMKQIAGTIRRALGKHG